MTKQEFEGSATDKRTVISMAPGGPGLLRQAGNGIGGLIVLLLSGLILVLVVLMKSR